MTDPDYLGDIVAVVDESSPVAGAGIAYLISTAIVVEPIDAAAACRQVIGERVRPFHWHREGPKAREGMLELVNDRVIEVFCQYRSVPRSGQVAGRRAILGSQLPMIEGAGVSHLIIESGDRHSDRRDRSTILDAFSDRTVPFQYDWRTKDEPLLWIADAISGAVSEHLTGKDDDAFNEISSLVTPDYLA